MAKWTGKGSILAENWDELLVEALRGRMRQGRVRTLADMSAQEIWALERHYGVRIAPPRVAIPIVTPAEASTSGAEKE